MFPPTALVPVKVSGRSKLRLAHRIDARERAHLAASLLAGVVDALSSAGLRTVVLASGDVRAPEHVEVWPEARPGLNPALREALRALGGTGLVVPADLPALRAEHVHRLLREPGDVVVAPTADLGTGALLMRRPVVPQFGPRSALAHAAAARTAGLRARVVRLDGFFSDLDDEIALTRYAGAQRNGAGR